MVGGVYEIKEYEIDVHYHGNRSMYTIAFHIIYIHHGITTLYHYGNSSMKTKPQVKSLYYKFQWKWEARDCTAEKLFQDILRQIEFHWVMSLCHMQLHVYVEPLTLLTSWTDWCDRHFLTILPSLYSAIVSKLCKVPLISCSTAVWS